MTTTTRSAVLLILLASTIGISSQAAAADDKSDSAVVIKEDFSNGADHWQPSDPTAWKVIRTDHGSAYSLTKLSNYKPPHRSPFGFSLLKDVVVGDFTLTVDAQTTKKEYPHLDLDLFFGYQDPDHFYYVHFGRKTDDHANQIFIVNGADRVKISTKTNEGTPWDRGWHKLKLVRNAADGSIEAYFDDLTTPAMTASDKHFLWGQVGLGSFDDTGNFTNVNLSGTRAKPETSADKK